MSTKKTIELLGELKLKVMSSVYEETLRLAEKNSWGFNKFVKNLCELELDSRRETKTNRLLKQSQIPANYSIESLDPKLLTANLRKILPSLLEGDFIGRSENILAFGLPGRGKSHYVGAIGRELILKYNMQVLFIPTFKLVEKLLVAKKELQLEKALKKLDKFDLIILDDIGYIQQSQSEMEVLFSFLAERYERKSLIVTSNLVFSKWDKIFKDKMTTMAAIDRLVHHSIILEFKGPSLRINQKSK